MEGPSAVNPYDPSAQALLVLPVTAALIAFARAETFAACGVLLIVWIVWPVLLSIIFRRSLWPMSKGWLRSECFFKNSSKASGPALTIVSRAKKSAPLWTWRYHVELSSPDLLLPFEVRCSGDRLPR